MNENMDVNYEDFFESFDGVDGNQTDTGNDAWEEESSEATEEPETEDADSEAAEEPVSDETAEGNESQNADKDGAEDEAEADNSIPEQKFVVKVNKETREVSYQDAPAWIQKGMDYDRVKGQLETAQKNEQELRAELDRHRPYLDTLAQMAEEQQMDIPELLDHVEMSVLIGQGMSEKEARATLRAIKAERQVKAAEQKEAPAKEQPEEESEDNRAVQEVQEFMQNFPDVKLSDEQIEAMKPYVQKGMSMSTAYLMVEKAKLEEAVKQKEAAEAAREKNKSNRAKAPSSQKDSGGQRSHSAEDDFFAAFDR